MKISPQSNQQENFVQWTPNMMCEVLLEQPEDFLIVKETLTRMGIAAKGENRLCQSCHVLHKRGKYYILHFKELFALDGKPTTLTKTDIARRNTIAKLLDEWGHVQLVNPAIPSEEMVPIKEIKIISNKEKSNWSLDAKYSIGKFRNSQTAQD